RLVILLPSIDSTTPSRSRTGSHACCREMLLWSCSIPTSRRTFVTPSGSTRFCEPRSRHSRAEARAGQAERIEAGRLVRTLQYLVRINKDADSDWGASVPDLPGCVATAKTIDAALRRVQVAIQLHLRGMREDGLRPPRPRHR